MMRNFILISVLCCLFAARGASIVLPESVSLGTGDLKVRLDNRKACYMNRIEWKGQLVCVDNAGSHYGTVFYVEGADGFVGSGHIETGFREEVQSLSITVDGKNVDYLKQKEFKGETIRVVKTSKVRDFLVKYTLDLGKDRFDEVVEITAEKEVKLHNTYQFMHPWSTDFTDLYFRSAGGREGTIEFKTDNKFLLQEAVPAAAWYNRRNGIGFTTVILPGEGQKNYCRFVWDCKRYRKDYIVDFRHAVFPAGHKSVYRSRTAFFSQPDAAKWIDDAKTAAAALEKE